MLLNPNFEGGWTRKTHTGVEFGEIFVPENWVAYWKEGKPVPHDPTNQNGYGRPEVHVINAEPPFLDPLRIYNGNRSMKLFTFFRIHWAGLYQRVEVTPGSLIKFSGFAHAWSSTEDDAKKSDGITSPTSFLEGTPGLTDAQKNFTFRVGIDPYGMNDPWSDNIIWGTGKHIYNVFDQIPEVEAVAVSKYVTVFVQSEVLYPFKHADAYIDHMQFEEIPGTPPPNQECKGLPRIDYERTVHLMPKNPTKAQREKVTEAAYPNRETILYSADDAGIGSLSKKTVKIWWFTPTSWTSKVAMDNFFSQYYPGTTVVHIIDYVVEPPPTPGNPPVPIVHYSKNFIGLHQCFLKTDWDKYIRETHPTVTKCFTCGDTIAVKKVEPRVLSVWRKHIDADGTWLEGDRKANAKKFLDLYSNEVQVHCWNEGIPEAEALAMIDVMESINETVPSNNQQHIEKAVEFDCWFSDLLHERYGNQVKAGILTVAVGNPLEDEVSLLLAAAKRSHEGNAVLGYHSYWAADSVKSYIDTGWQWHAGRWQEWDKVFNAAGYYPTYYLGESGICYTYPESNGAQFVPTRGWKSCGSFPNYIAQIEKFNSNITVWNATHQGRCYGGTLYAYGIWNWDDFDWNPGDLALLITAIKKYA